MSNNEIRNLLAELQDELQKAEVNAEMRTLVEKLDSDIQDLLDSTAIRDDKDSVMARARQLETDFASEHPTAERFMREVIETLARMGI
jgi:hypothetical protein